MPPTQVRKTEWRSGGALVTVTTTRQPNEDYVDFVERHEAAVLAKAQTDAPDDQPIP